MIKFSARKSGENASWCLNADNNKLESVVEHRHALAASSWTNQVKCIHSQVD